MEKGQEALLERIETGQMEVDLCWSNLFDGLNDIQREILRTHLDQIDRVLNHCHTSVKYPDYYFGKGEANENQI